MKIIDCNLGRKVEVGKHKRIRRPYLWFRMFWKSFIATCFSVPSSGYCVLLSSAVIWSGWRFVFHHHFFVVIVIMIKCMILTVLGNYCCDSSFHLTCAFWQHFFPCSLSAKYTRATPGVFSSLILSLRMRFVERVACVSLHLKEIKTISNFMTTINPYWKTCYILSQTDGERGLYDESQVSLMVHVFSPDFVRRQQK